MVKFKLFSRLNRIFSRLNLHSSDFLGWDKKVLNPPSSDELLEKSIKEYSEFEKVILASIYHLINTQNVDKEYLTVLTKNNVLIADLIEGEGDKVEIPSFVKMEGEKYNILIACHNHFLGAVMPSLDDVGSTLDHNCQFMSIVSCNHIGILINESDEIEWAEFLIDFEIFVEYMSFCLENEKFDDLDKIDMLNISEEERELMKSIIFDRFISDNLEKFVNEFNMRFNKYNIYKLYIDI